MPARSVEAYFREIGRIQASQILDQINVSSFPHLKDEESRKKMKQHYVDLINNVAHEEVVLSDPKDLMRALSGV